MTPAQQDEILPLLRHAKRPKQLYFLRVHLVTSITTLLYHHAVHKAAATEPGQVQVLWYRQECRVKTCPRTVVDLARRHHAHESCSQQCESGSSERKVEAECGQITLLGFAFVLVNVATLLILDPTYIGRELPSWVYLS
jgi:hypothetical protein